MKKILHIAQRGAERRSWAPVMREAISGLGEFEIVENAEDMTEDERAERIRACHILVTGWGSAKIPESVAADPGDLEYVCNLTGTVRGFVPLNIVEAGIPLTNWGDAPAVRLAEGALTLLLAALKDLHYHIVLVRQGGWKMDPAEHGGTLEDLPVGVYGCGVIGRAFIEMLKPHGAEIYVFDPYIDEVPDGVRRVDSLDHLFATCKAVAIHAGLSDETRNSVTARHLAMLPDYGIVVNTARGGIVDQEALFAELKTGRLRAGLDVLEPDKLPDDHPARQWDNVIFTAHQIGGGQGPWPTGGQPPQQLSRMQRICLENIRRHIAGQPLQFLMDRTRYLRST